MVRGTIFSRARKQKGELWSGGTNSLGNCLYPSLETRKRGQFGELFVPEPRNSKVRQSGNSPFQLVALKLESDHVLEGKTG